MSEETPSTSISAGNEGKARKPTVVIAIGMAGSGKTTFVQRLNSYLHQHQKTTETQSTTTPAYLINLDPAVTHLPYEPNIDMRDTVDYKGVMKQ
jgi:GTPase SAR1 family protein